MILLLIRIGRVALIIAAYLSIPSGMIGGYLLAHGNGNLSGDSLLANGFYLTPLELVAIVIGGSAGILVAGVLGGSLAALFEIQRDCRIMRERSEPIERLPHDDQPTALRAYR